MGLVWGAFACLKQCLWAPSAGVLDVRMGSYRIIVIIVIVVISGVASAGVVVWVEYIGSAASNEDAGERNF